MKPTVRSLLITIVLALFLPAVASAQSFYAAFRGGPNWTPATNDGRPGFEDPSAHKMGQALGGAFGYAWPSGLRLEGEFSFVHAPVKSDAGVPTGGSIKVYAPMANVSYETRPASRGSLRAYAGFGIGTARLNHNDEFISAGGVKMQANEWGTAVSFQVRAGIGCDINKRLDFSVGYRFLRSAGSHILQGADQHQVNFDVVKNHSIEVGLRIKF